MRAYLLAGVVATGSLALPGAARAEFKVCNKSGQTASVSFGYRHAERGWTSEGWWVVEPGDCTTIVTGELANRYYYVYATGDEGGTWSGTKRQKGGHFCVSSKKFTLYNEHYLEGDTLDCEKRGYKTRKFDEIDTEDYEDFTYNLTE